ncbi:hypothetical protein GQ457_07G004640 [Hibiscus cannabinus]
MKRHTERCKKAPFNLEKTQTILDFESKTKCNADGTIETVSVPKLWRFDQDKIREALANVDNASSNDLAVKYLKQIVNLWDGSVLDAQFLHMRCAVHILNLVVKDGLKDVDDSVMKVSVVVKYVRSSPVRLQKFRSCIEEENINNKSLVCLDIETRKVGGPPDDEDWDKVTAFLPFLDIFYEATLSFSGSRYVTGNNFVEEIFHIGYTINHYLDDSNVGLKSMARQMKMKFDKYWANVNNVNVLMFIALVLDPRHKLIYVEWIVRRSYDPTNSFALCHRIKETLTSLFEFYASSQPPASQMKSSSIESSGHDFVNEVELFDTSETTELDKYLGDKCVRETDDFDIFSWWSMQNMNYPILMRMAHDVLAIPVSTVASESVFSTGGHVLDSFRTSLTPRLVEALICTQDWIRASHNTIVVEENLLALENMEEEMQDLISEQPTIIIDETNEVSDVTYEEPCP